MSELEVATYLPISFPYWSVLIQISPTLKSAGYTGVCITNGTTSLRISCAKSPNIVAFSTDNAPAYPNVELACDNILPASVNILCNFSSTVGLVSR